MIGLYGGTFAPVHNGHIRFAIEAREQLGLEAVHVLVAARPPHRDQPAIDGWRRHEWLRQAIGDEAGLVADDDELRHDGISYTADTLARARDRFPGHTCLWLVGADAFNKLHRWHQWQRIFEHAHVVVASRPGHPLSPAPEVRAYPRVDADGLRARAHGCWHALAIPELDIASTAIRMRIRAGRSLRGVVPDSLLRSLTETDLAALAAID
ncbi:nicotinate (nicotinamide) nucleotide adenylyltransferase [Algiphilus sp.]|uniref:nicotinate (nicotinamide) nucleotide adenylyltransferase n=1 Tax=Algiphilus sp. TaxID=1872431 RepID=UPI0025C70082|nr:nicotinate (nicotinamide) nucleotide adenylyltransferase [Algiphilus sp.]MCK5770451.1 nicotinate (nicotinamide) nucleotide adenylyltransferase [Algiphilus sp.]